MNTIIINQIIILSILVIVGVIAAKVKLLTENVNHSLSEIIFYITLPLLIFTSIASVKISNEIVNNCILVFIFTSIAIFFLYATALLTSLIFKFNYPTSVVHKVHTMFGNTIFLGFPLMKMLYGEEGLLYATVYQLSSDAIMWTFGVYIMNPKKGKGILESLKPLINPNTIAFVLGFTFMALNIQLPYILNNSLGNLGHTTIPLSMLYIGGMISLISIKGILKHNYIFIMTINKMIISPVVIFIILFFLNRYLQFKLSFIALSVIILQVATPAMATIVILCKKYQCDDKQATENVFISTLLSIITLPLIYYLINHLFKIL